MRQSMPGMLETHARVVKEDDGGCCMLHKNQRFGGLATHRNPRHTSLDGSYTSLDRCVPPVGQHVRSVLLDRWRFLKWLLVMGGRCLGLSAFEQRALLWT